MPAVQRATHRAIARPGHHAAGEAGWQAHPVGIGRLQRAQGRQLTRANLREVRETIDWLEKKIDNASDASGGFDLVSIGRQS
jgi:hypothetical protein